MTTQAQERSIKLFPHSAPNQHTHLVEQCDTSGERSAQRTVTRLRQVDTPTLTLYKAAYPTPDNRCVVVCPGGGYYLLSYDLEGSEVCQWLNSQGIHAALLKYRVPRRKGDAKHAAAFEDAQRAISVLRSHATEFGINPHQLGMMGFSAGAHLTAMCSTHYSERSYPTIDACDTVSNLRPDFAILIYPAYLDSETARFELAPEITPTPHTPPTFMAQAENDTKYVNSSLYYYYALKELGVPATLHLYDNGGHGFGLRQHDTSSDRWIEDLKVWLQQL